MAKITFYGLDKFSNQLINILDKTDDICKKALEAGQEKMKPIMLHNLRNAIGKTRTPSRSTGELVRSFGVTTIKKGYNGDFNLKLGFNEPRINQPRPVTETKQRRRRKEGERGRSYYAQTNALIANVLNYGRGKPIMQPTHWMDKSKRQAKQTIEKAMLEAVEKAIEAELNK